MAQSKTLSTGILAPDSQLDGVRIDVVNLNPTLSQTVTVAVFGWGVDPVMSENLICLRLLALPLASSMRRPSLSRKI